MLFTREVKVQVVNAADVIGKLFFPALRLVFPRSMSVHGHDLGLMAGSSQICALRSHYLTCSKNNSYFVGTKPQFKQELI